MDRESGFEIQVASSKTGMSAEAVKAALQLEVVDDTPFAGLSVSGSDGAYTVTATEGYTPGSSYKLTLTDPALTFVGETRKRPYVLLHHREAGSGRCYSWPPASSRYPPPTSAT